MYCMSHFFSTYFNITSGTYIFPSLKRRSFLIDVFSIIKIFPTYMKCTKNRQFRLPWNLTRKFDVNLNLCWHSNTLYDRLFFLRVSHPTNVNHCCFSIIELYSIFWWKQRRKIGNARFDSTLETIYV